MNKKILQALNKKTVKNKIIFNNNVILIQIKIIQTLNMIRKVNKNQKIYHKYLKVKILIKEQTHFLIKKNRIKEIIPIVVSNLLIIMIYKINLVISHI